MRPHHLAAAPAAHAALRVGRLLVVRVLTVAALTVVALGAGCSPATPSPTVVGPAPRQAPDTGTDVFTALEANPRFGTFVRLARAAGLEPNLRRDGQWTVLAPTDEAFERLPAGTVEGLLRPEGLEAVVALVRNHLVEGFVTADELRKRSDVETVHGAFLSVATVSGRIRVEGSRVVLVDLEADNGVVHGLEMVLVPRVADPD